MQLKEYLRDVCNYEKMIYEGQLKLQKIRREITIAKSSAESKKKRLEEAVSNKFAEVKDVEKQIVNRERMMLPSGGFEIFISVIAIIITILIQAGIRFLILDGWNANSVMDVTAYIAIVHGIMAIGIIILFVYFGGNDWKIVLFVAIIAYIASVIVTYAFCNFCVSKGISLGNTLLISHIIIDAFEIIIAIAFCCYKKVEYNKYFYRNQEKIKLLKKQVITIRAEYQKLVKSVQDFDETSKKSLQAMSQDAANQEKALRDLRAKLARMYAQNVLHPNYQNWVAAATIYEYLDVGRCFELKGVNGAYNLFEKELLANKILQSLSDINGSVRHYGNVINTSQQYIRYQLYQCNKNIESLQVERYGL